MGYKAFEIRKGKGSTFDLAADLSADNSIIENELYKLTINKAGVIESLLDKKNRNRECIGKEKANDLGSISGTGSITVENAGAVSVTVKVESTDPLSHVSRITLYRNLPRIDIDNQISENFKDVRKWKFDFNLNTPDTWHEEAGAVLNAKLTSHGGHYATENALYKYLTLNHFVSMTEKNYGITLSNRDCYFFQLGNSTHNSLEETSNTLHILAGGRVSNPELGIIDQDGESEFNQSFSLRTHKGFNKVSEMRFALEHQNPLTAGTITGSGVRYPNTSYSYLNISDPDVLLWALKPSEENYPGGGIIIRTWNLGNQMSAGKINLNENISQAYETTHVETDISECSFSKNYLNTNTPPQGMNTYRVFPEGSRR